MSKLSKESVDSFEALMGAAVDAIIIISDRGEILRFNPAAQAMFAYAEADVVGENVRILMPSPHREQHDGYLSSFLDGRPATIIGFGREETAVRSDGELFPIHLSVGQARIGDQVSFVGIIRDLSVEKRAQEATRELEQQLIHADRLVTLGELTAGIAHEINQPLTAIAAYADAGKRLIDSGRGETDELQLICGKVAEQARRAAEVIVRLRGLARKGAVTKREHNLRKIINNVLLIIENEMKKLNCHVDVQIGEGVHDLHVDEVQIQQVLVNLIKNGMDVMSHAGQTQGKLDVTARRVGDWVEIEVVDNGPGVEPEVVERLFEPFFTTKPYGVGLGLSICKNIAAAHGGGLSYEPALNGGSSFTLILPAESMG